MIKQYEELSPIAQTSLDNLRNEILRGDVDLSVLENNREGLAAFIGFCTGFLRGQGCSLAEASAAVMLARGKKFWLVRKQTVTVDTAGLTFDMIAEGPPQALNYSDMGVSIAWDGTY